MKVDSNKHPSCRRIIWVGYTKICTFLIPDKLLVYLSLTTQARRIAWREKFTLFITYGIICSIFCFWLEFITALFCDPPRTYDYETIYSNNSQQSTINGQVVDWHELGNLTQMTSSVNQYPAMDLSPMFPSFMQLQRPKNQLHYNNYIIDECIQRSNRSAEADNWLLHKLTQDSGYQYKNDQLVSCPIPGKRNITGAPCFYSLLSQHEFNKYPKKGFVKYNEDRINKNFTTLPYQDMSSQAFVVIDNVVLDVTDYLTSVTNIVKVAKGSHSRAFALDRMFLPLDITILLFTSMGLDITPYFHNGDIQSGAEYIPCLKELFFHGVLARNENEGCDQRNLALWITMGCFLFYFLLKVNLSNLSRLHCLQRLFKSSKRPGKQFTLSCSNRYLPPFVLFFIPCYAESSETIKQTLDSLARTSYPDNRKLLFFVCDGLAKSRSDGGKETYACILESLGYSSTKDPELRSYVSLGQGARKINHAKVYAGFYESGRNRVPFLMVVKIGSVFESGKRVPGNRGKRDSMVMVLSFLERCMNLSHNRISPLEFELFNQCYNLLGIDPRCLKYMLVTDADTQVQDDVVVRLVSRLEADPNLLAVNGYIRPANPEENIVTMLQIFPLYTMFYSGLAYEACLGCVATINGGFIMYRLWNDTNTNYQSNNYTMNQLPSHQLNKWPKVSDEIIEPSSPIANTTITSWRPPDNNKHDDDDDDTSSDDNLTTVSSRKINSSTNSQQQHHRRRTFNSKKKKSRQDTVQFSLAPNQEIEPICIQPTVLRGFATPIANTMHMENVLLLGEDQYLSTVLLKSHPNHRIGFEPEAIAYTTIPSNFFALQALQLRNIRSTFHALVEFQYIASHLGFRYWITSFTKLLDMVLSMPIIVYLYGVYIRYFIYKYQVYATIAGAFTGLIMLHILYFLVRRQFKYVFWFIIYGLFSVPLFNIYFPVLSVWFSDDGYRWYDVWPTKSEGYHSRLHGIVPDKDETKIQQEEEEVVRMRLVDFEVLEAERQARREKEQVELLDAKFNGFTGYVGSHTSKPSWSSANDLIPTPPLAQTREGYKLNKTHSRFASEDDARFLLSNRSSTPRTNSFNSINSSNPHNPFASMLDDPFDDIYSPPRFNNTTQHKPTQSQSSYFGQTSTDFGYPNTMFNPHHTNTPTSRSRSYSTSSVLNTDFYNRTEPVIKDTDSIISLSNSVISLERDAPSPPLPEPQISLGGRRRLHAHPVDEGRSAPVHSRIVFEHP
ncbi:hypothetical protein MFLAVUS_007577 [Mucor flavus]|uniref:chitin synthase n=1 Tax=Mucor flavus TaxID=439312 RepID=A0ABP9Z4P8_9FUNG